VEQNVGLLARVRYSEVERRDRPRLFVASDATRLEMPANNLDVHSGTAHGVSSPTTKNARRDTVFARKQLCSQSNIIACFCYGKLYSQPLLKSSTRPRPRSTFSKLEEWLPEGVARTGTPGGS
jgi:hypothetical protein